MTTLYFWCTHELYSKNKLLRSTVKSHLSLRQNRHHLVNTKCILNTVSRVSSNQNNFFFPQQYNYISSFNTLLIFNKHFNCCTRPFNTSQIREVVLIIYCVHDSGPWRETSATSWGSSCSHRASKTMYLSWGDITRWDLLQKEQTHRIHIPMVHYSQLPKAFVRLQYFQ